MLRRIELEVLSTVDRGDTISELATKLDHSESYLSRAVADLVDKGLVDTEKASMAPATTHNPKTFAK